MRSNGLGPGSGYASISFNQRHHRARAQHAKCQKHKKHQKCQKHHNHRKKHKHRRQNGQRTPVVPAPVPTPGLPTPSSGTIQHVVWIMMENNDYSNMYGPQPYETQVANTYGLAEDYYGIGHYSADNYIAATSGISWNSCLGGDGSASAVRSRRTTSSTSSAPATPSTTSSPATRTAITILPSTTPT